MSTRLCATLAVAVAFAWWVHKRNDRMLQSSLDYQRGRTYQLSKILVEQYRRGGR